MLDAACASTPAAPHLHPPHAAWVRYLVRPSFAARRAVLRGLSPGAAGLLAEEGLEPGTLLLLELPGSRPEDVHSRLARVWSAEPRESGGYLLRCRFTGPPGDPARAIGPHGPAQPPAESPASEAK
jgi:hypothetical protein